MKGPPRGDTPTLNIFKHSFCSFNAFTNFKQLKLYTSNSDRLFKKCVLNDGISVLKKKKSF